MGASHARARLYYMATFVLSHCHQFSKMRIGSHFLERSRLFNHSAHVAPFRTQIAIMRRTA